ncbi:hypothetical protein J6590_019917 [Homalodisca vitripennis]|nr:hypothetical protein J6590_019917 [Homalodisca vitripennis]
MAHFRLEYTKGRYSSGFQEGPSWGVLKILGISGYTLGILKTIYHLNLDIRSDSSFLQESIPNRPGIGSGEGCKCQVDTYYARSGRAASVRSIPLMPGQSDSSFLQESIPNRPGIGSGKDCKCQTGDRVRGGLQVSGRYLLCPVSLTVAFFRNLYRTDRGYGQGRAASVRSITLIPGQSDSGFLQESIPNRPGIGSGEGSSVDFMPTGIGSGEGCKCQSIPLMPGHTVASNHTEQPGRVRKGASVRSIPLMLDQWLSSGIYTEQTGDRVRGGLQVSGRYLLCPESIPNRPGIGSGEGCKCQIDTSYARSV